MVFAWSGIIIRNRWGGFRSVRNNFRVDLGLTGYVSYPTETIAGKSPISGDAVVGDSGRIKGQYRTFVQ